MANLVNAAGTSHELGDGDFLSAGEAILRISMGHLIESVSDRGIYSSGIPENTGINLLY